MIAKNEETIANVSVEAVKVEAAPDNEKFEKVKDLKKSLKDVEQKQEKEVKDLKRVQASIKSIVDPATEPATEYTDKHIEPKPDTSAFKKNLAVIMKEEERKEEVIEARKAA